jgi:hypothetical protein
MELVKHTFSNLGNKVWCQQEGVVGTEACRVLKGAVYVLFLRGN